MQSSGIGEYILFGIVKLKHGLCKVYNAGVVNPAVQPVGAVRRLAVKKYFCYFARFYKVSGVTGRFINVAQKAYH